MIIDNSYFIDEIFIPHAKPGITDDVTSVGADMTSFIDNYSREALVKCLGYALFKEFSAQLDSSKPNGLKDLADAKWNNLLNGVEYTTPSGKLVEWRGIRYKTGDVYNKSFLADYVYFFYEKSADDDRTGVGNVQQNAKNATNVSKTPKVIAAWRRFYKNVQGESAKPRVIVKRYDCFGISGVGIDWYGQSEFIDLYRFINDTNQTTPNTYADFHPFVFENLNQFGI